jgi:pimeloyl-ACP methyl ester carboxylesterase
MDKANIGGVELEYEVVGSGEPVLLIAAAPIADGFHPFLREKALTDRYRLIAYRQRGQTGRPPAAGVEVVSFEQHAADAAGLLRHLDVARAHVAGHGTGADIAMQLTADEPGLVATLALLEPPLLSVPSAAAFFEKAAPALAAFGSGDRERAMALFLSAVSGLEWHAARIAIQKHVPGGVARAMTEADNFFAGYLPALNQWPFGKQQAATIAQPVLSVVGTDTEQWFTDGRALLHGWLPQLEDCTAEGVGHLLHMQRPERVVPCVAAWLKRHPLRS